METNNAKTQVYNLIILDKSGSMSSIEQAAIAGFNETVGGIRSVYNCTPIDQVRNLDRRDYQPCCGTPLFDAMGRGINDLLQKTHDVEGATVVVTIITDGMENSSTEYSGAAIKALVDKMRDVHGWNFAYIGTNQDVESVAMSLSITNTMYFEDSASGMSEAWERERKSRQDRCSSLEATAWVRIMAVRLRRLCSNLARWWGRPRGCRATATP